MKDQIKSKAVDLRHFLDDACMDMAYGNDIEAEEVLDDPGMIADLLGDRIHDEATMIDPHRKEDIIILIAEEIQNNEFSKKSSVYIAMERIIKRQKSYIKSIKMKGVA